MERDHETATKVTKWICAMHPHALLNEDGRKLDEPGIS